MPARGAPVLWWELTPVQRALLVRVAREGRLARLLPWEGRTVRSLVARALLKRIDGASRSDRLPGWVLTARGRRLLAQAAAPVLEQACP